MIEPGARRSLGRKPRPGESLVYAFLIFCAGISIFTTIGIIASLVKDAWPFFERANILEFLTGSVWEPVHEPPFVGIWPLLASTIITSLIAMVVAIPLGLAVAIYLSEYAKPRVREVLKPILEVLAGIPTVVYGYFALSSVTPALRGIFGAENLQIYNMLSPGLVMGILILPYISSMCEDALSSVPKSLKEASFAMGATKLETAIQVILPSAISGVAAAFIIGLSRAIGETMIVALAAGAGPKLTLNPLEGAETITGHIVRISKGDIERDPFVYTSIFALGLVLFLVTLGLNILSRRVIKKYREVYE
jgi:phosphate transport system permease protein